MRGNVRTKAIPHFRRDCIGLRSGSGDTEFYNRFGADFPDVKRMGKPTEIHLDASGSNATVRGLRLPLVEIQLGGSTVSIRDETLLTKASPDKQDEPHVWLGLDALSKAPHVSLDFRAMQFSLK